MAQHLFLIQHCHYTELLPQLMDERFPLYYEDTDLMRELSKRGYRLVATVTDPASDTPLLVVFYAA